MSQRIPQSIALLTNGHFGFLGLLRLPLNHPGTAAVKFFTRIF
jgi:hypothetical protein